MTTIDSNVALYRLLTSRLTEHAPKLTLSRPLADLANYMVFEQLPKKLYQEDIEDFCRNYTPSRRSPDDFGPFCLPLLRSPRNAECVEISEAVVRLAMELFTVVYAIGCAKVDHGIVFLIGILELSSEQYLKCRAKRGRLRLKSTAKFEGKFGCQVRLKIACSNPFDPFSKR